MLVGKYISASIETRRQETEISKCLMEFLDYEEGDAPALSAWPLVLQRQELSFFFFFFLFRAEPAAHVFPG